MHYFYMLFLILLCWLTTLEVFGVPARTVLLVVLVLHAALSDPRRLNRVIFKTTRSPYFLVGIILLIIGIVVSLFEDIDTYTIITTGSRYILQALLLLILLNYLLDRYGARKIIIPYLAIVGISGSVAIAQSIGIDSAWLLRVIIAKYTVIDNGAAIFFEQELRAMGLAFNPVQMGYQALIGIFLTYMLASSISKKVVFFLSCFFLLVIVSTGLRSAFLAALVFFTIYLIVNWSGKSIPKIAFIIVTILVLSVIYVSLDKVKSDARVLNYSGSSAVSRYALNYLGVRLLADKMSGYGFGFRSQDYASKYRSDLLRFEKGGVTEFAALHNAIIYLGLVYGLPGIIGLLYLLVSVYWNGNWIQWMALFAFLINTFFHNSGLFVGDLLVMFIAMNVQVEVENIQKERKLYGR